MWPRSGAAPSPCTRWTFGAWCACCRPRIPAAEAVPAGSAGLPRKEPGNGLAQAVVDPVAGRVAQQRNGLGDIGLRMTHVAGAKLTITGGMPCQMGTVFQQHGPHHLVQLIETGARVD